MDFIIKEYELNEKVELMSIVIHFLQLKLSLPSFILPAVGITLLNYFAFNLEDESYFLPIPIMYAQLLNYKKRFDHFYLYILKGYHLIGGPQSAIRWQSFSNFYR